MGIPKRGEVWLVDLGFVAKTRPCLVISIPAQDQDRALATLVPYTTSPRGSRFEVEVKIKFLRSGVFDVQSIVTIPHAKLIRKLGVLSPEQLSAVEATVRLWLMSNQPPPPSPMVDLVGPIVKGAAIIAAGQLGLFKVLAEGPRSISEIASATGSSETGMALLVEALASVGYLERVDDRYVNGPTARAWLTPASQVDFTPGLWSSFTSF